MNSELKNTSEYKIMSLADVFKYLETSIEGLTSEESNNRIKKNGYNEIVVIKKIQFLNFSNDIGVQCLGC